MQLVFDIETDGLLEEMTMCHTLVCQDIKTKKLYRYTDHQGFPSIKSGLDFMLNADALIGHNIIGFDLMALEKLFNWKPSSKTVLIDTWVMSQVLNFQRPHKHGLGGWGSYLGHKKQDNSIFNEQNWKIYSRQMMEYCTQDVQLNTKVYEILLKELNEIANTNPLIRKGLRVEHDIAIFESMIRDKGWLFDREKALKNLNLMRKHMSKIDNIMEPKLGKTKIYLDKIPKTPKYTKSGLYTATTARILSEYFNKTILAEDAVSDDPPIAPGTEFQRSTIEPITLANMDLVKDWLYTIGWKPDDWNVMKGDRGQWIRT